MSGAVRDSTGAMLDTRFLKIVSQFHVEQTRIGILYSGVTPRSTIDISDEVNSQVAAANGEAVIRLSITVDGSCSPLNAFPVLNIVPVWPGCVPVSIDGLIVKRRPLPKPATAGPSAVEDQGSFGRVSRCLAGLRRPRDPPTGDSCNARLASNIRLP